VAYVVDASVAVKWLVTEDETDQAVALLQSGADLYAPILMQQEVSNTLWKKCRAGNISVADATNRIERLPKYVRPIAVEPDLVATFQLAIGIDHPVYDCVYLQAAIESGLPLITADRALARRARGLQGAAVILLSEWTRSVR
jgi:predicted nucleic acid-binding protein